jgi:hypothetical protein
LLEIPILQLHHKFRTVYHFSINQIWVLKKLTKGPILADTYLIKILGSLSNCIIKEMESNEVIRVDLIISIFTTINEILNFSPKNHLSKPEYIHDLFKAISLCAHEKELIKILEPNKSKVDKKTSFLIKGIVIHK